MIYGDFFAEVGRNKIKFSENRKSPYLTSREV